MIKCLINGSLSSSDLSETIEEVYNTYGIDKVVNLDISKQGSFYSMVMIYDDGATPEEEVG